MELAGDETFHCALQRAAATSSGATGNFTKNGCTLNHSFRASAGEAQLSCALHVAIVRARVWSTPALCTSAGITASCFYWLWVGVIYCLPIGFHLKHKKSSRTSPRSRLVNLFCLSKEGLNVSRISHPPCTHISCSGRSASAQFGLSDKS